MSFETEDQLEMQLRVLGRKLGDCAPGQELLTRVQADAGTVLTARKIAVAVQAQRRRKAAFYLLIIATMPIPALFVWVDWSAATSVFSAVLPHGASAVVSGVYLWLKVVALVLMYGIGIGGAAYAAFAARRSEGEIGGGMGEAGVVA
jgi:hypothetical protein